MRSIGFVAEWNDYQESVAAFFRELDLTARTDVALQGVRTSHAIDVVVDSHHVGFEVRWIVECKLWKTAVPKEKVLALRSVVEDLGVDRGILMAEGGYQSGALEAATHANVLLTSLADLRETLDHELGMAALRSIAHRLEVCRDRYWALGKSDRINAGLRPHSGAYGYSGDVVTRAVDYALRVALFRGFPLTYERTLAALASHGGLGRPSLSADNEDAIATPRELYDVLDGELRELEELLDAAE